MVTHVASAPPPEPVDAPSPRLPTSSGAPAASALSLPRLEALTGLRWVAALGVFLFHVREFYPLPGMGDLALFGNSGVTFFFILSGFVLTWSFSPQDTARRFYWRRFVRIWPALAVSTALAVPVFYVGKGIALGGAEQLGILASLALLQAWIPEVLFAGNPAAWSLSDEAFFYAVFPLVIRPLTRAPGWFLAVLAMALAVAGGALRWWAWGVGDLTQHGTVMLFVSPPARAGEFILGMAIAAAMRRGWRCPMPVWTAAGLTAAGIAALWYCQTHVNPYLPDGRADDAMNQVTGPLYALLIAAVASRDLRGRWMLLRSRPMVALGRWSFAFYLVHATVLHWLAQHWTPKQPPTWDNWHPLLVTIGAGLAVAMALYALVERPVERALRHLPGRLRRRPQSS